MTIFPVASFYNRNFRKAEIFAAIILFTVCLFAPASRIARADPAIQINPGEHLSFPEQEGADGTASQPAPQSEADREIKIVTPSPQENVSHIHIADEKHNSPAAHREMDLGDELYAYMQKLPHFEIGGSAEGEPKLMVFGWETCPSCQTFKEAVMRKNLPFRAWEVPVAGDPQADRLTLERLGVPAGDVRSVMNRLVDGALIVHTLTGELRVPAYLWVLPDGTRRFGHIGMADALYRLDLIKSLYDSGAVKAGDQAESQ